MGINDESSSADTPSEPEIVKRLESNVRAYCRTFPGEFSRAEGSFLESTDGTRYLDFFSGAGALNYGHNPEGIIKDLIAHLEGGSILHALDASTTTKCRFLELFESLILKPRELDYKVQFCGPTGTNAVEAALKLSWKATSRTGVIAFCGGFHGMSLGSLSVSGGWHPRASAVAHLFPTTFIPYPDGPLGPFDSIDLIARLLNDPDSGVVVPASIIVETIQAEGGVYVATPEWLQSLRKICTDHGILLILDDVQVGCGRTGTFFSFEQAGIVPDMIVLSKSISGCGLPMSILLIRPELDCWTPGEHSGTFRGNQLAFVGAIGAMRYWENSSFATAIQSKGHRLGELLLDRVASCNPCISIRGSGMIWGVDLGKCGPATLARQVQQESFRRGLVVEACGRQEKVIKLLPPLTTELECLELGCDLLAMAIKTVLNAR